MGAYPFGVRRLETKVTELPGILIVDDQVEAAKLLALHFERDGYQVHVAHNGPEGLKLAYEHQPSAVVLDVRMPGMDGYEVCGRLRDFSDAVILFVTVVNDRDAIVRGLQLGADDYLIKPFNYLVLLARIEACLRRRNIQRERSKAEPVPFTAWSLDELRREVIIGKRHVQLTPKEFEILQYFMAHPDTVHAADDILEVLWGPEYVGDPDLVKQFVYRLRSKLEPNPSEPQYFVTIRGAGYAFEPDTHPLIGKVDQVEAKLAASQMPVAEPGQLHDPPGRPGKSERSGVIVLPPPEKLPPAVQGTPPSGTPTRQPALGVSFQTSRESDPVPGWTIFIPRSSAGFRWLVLGVAGIAILASAAICRLALT